MTMPSVETLDREKDKLYLTDAELIRRLGVPEKIARAALHLEPLQIRFTQTRTISTGLCVMDWSSGRGGGFSEIWQTAANRGTVSL